MSRLRILSIRNRQRARAVHLPLLRSILRGLLEADLDLTSYELGLHLVGTKEMTRINGNYLQHEGSTDVITFDYSDSPAAHLQGEIFISIPDAIRHAKMFAVTWQAELVRYVIHGLLHLRGYDDVAAAPRREMKREENRLVVATRAQFPIQRLSRTIDSSASSRRSARREREPRRPDPSPRKKALRHGPEGARPKRPVPVPINRKSQIANRKSA